MKILALTGNPSKGNTWFMLRTIQETYPGIDFKLSGLGKMNFD